MKTDFSYGLIPTYADDAEIYYLLVQHHEGHWGFPKGHAEGDESPLAAACREFEEETGVHSYAVDESVSFNEEYFPLIQGQVVHKTVTYFPATIHDKTVVPQPEEVRDYGWFPFSEAKEKITFPGAKKILREAQAYLNKQEI